MILNESSFNRLYCKTLDRLITNPKYVVSPRGMKINEVTNATLILTAPRNRLITLPARKFSKKYFAGEVCFYLSGSRKLKDIAHYSKFWNAVSDDGKNVNSCYGYKLFIKKANGMSQYTYALKQLMYDKDTRKAVMEIYTSENNNLTTKDNPCTMYLQFFIRNNFLNLHTYMRSNDVWFGLAYDLPFFTIVQELMLVTLQQVYPSLQLGTYYHNAGSLHLYDKNIKSATDVLYDHPAYDSLCDLDSGSMVGMTDKSIGEIFALLSFEKELREKGTINVHDHRIEDKFLRTIAHYLTLEEK